VGFSTPFSVPEKKAQTTEATEKVESKAAKEPSAAPSKSPVKVNPLGACGLLFGCAKPKAVATPATKALTHLTAKKPQLKKIQ
jgi:hypothetical protein